MKKLKSKLSFISSNICNVKIERRFIGARGLLFLLLMLFTSWTMLAQPVKPGNLYVISRDKQNEVHWAKSGSPNMLEYRVYRSEDTVTFTYLGKVLSKDSTYYDNELINDKFYFYRVTALNKGGKESDFSTMDASSPQKDLSNSLNFDGNKSCLMIEDNKTLNLKPISSFSIEFWVKFTDPNPNGCLLSRQNNGDTASFYQLKISNGKFIFSLNGTNMGTSYNSPPVLPENWYHFVCTYQNNSDPKLRQLTIYLNGIKLDSLRNAAIPKEENKNSMLIFGAEWDTNGSFTNGFKGQIKEIRFWNYALTSHEISEKMNIPLRGDEPGMLGLWHCNGMFNKTVYDYTPNGNNASAFENVSVINPGGILINKAPLFVDGNNKHITVLTDSVKAGTTKRICLKVIDVGDSVSLINASSINRNGLVALSGTCFSYTSSPDFNGIDPFLLVVADKGTPVMYDTLQVNMNVYTINTAPVILDSLGHQVNRLNGSIDQDSVKKFSLTVADKERDSVSIYSIRSLGNHCNVVLVPDKNLSFTVIPATYFHGEDSLRVIVVDNGTPRMYDTVIFHINVINRNRAPQILNPLGFSANFMYKTIHHEPMETCLMIVDVDKDSTAITYGKSINWKGSVSFSGKNKHCFTYTPNENATGVDTTMIIVSDNGIPSLTDTVKVIFTIVPVNSPPVIVDEKNNHADTLKYSMNEGDPLEICLKVIDTNNDRDSITNIIQMHGNNGAQFGTISNTCISYQPASNFIGMDELIVSVSDHGDPIMHDSVIILINVKPKLIVSHAISPDGDGINDSWLIDGIEKYPNNTVTIFNQWGDVAYKVSGYDNLNKVWKGEARGGSVKMNKDLPNGTYFYIIDISGAKPLSGFIVVKR